MIRRKRVFIALLFLALLLPACGNSSSGGTAGEDAQDFKKSISTGSKSDSQKTVSENDSSDSEKSASGKDSSMPEKPASDEGPSSFGSSAPDETEYGGNFPVSGGQDPVVSTSACENCGGTGKVEIVLGCYGCKDGISFYTGKTCTQCDGAGNVIQELNCRECGGDGIVGNEASGYPAALPPGSTTGLDTNFPGFSGSSTPCPVCMGTGEKICPSCDGSGSLSQTKNAPNFGFGSSSYQVTQTCRACNGSGHVPCTSCGGDGAL